MIRAAFGGILLLLSAGCIGFYRDPAAEKAVRSYRNWVKEFPAKPLNREELFRKNPCRKGEIRELFARYSTAKADNDPAEAEICRVKLNFFAGYLPEAQLEYDLAGALDYPEEIADVISAEKAALIIDGGRTPAAELLCKVRIAHAQAVRAMQKRSTPREKLNYFKACLFLAEVIGVDLPELSALKSYVIRFDGAQKRAK